MSTGRSAHTQAAAVGNARDRSTCPPVGGDVRSAVLRDACPVIDERGKDGHRTCSAHRARVPDPDFHGQIIAEVERLRESDTIRVIDSLAVYKDPSGEIEAMHLSNLTQDEAIELGSKVGALIGLGFEGEEGMEAGAEAGAEAAAAGASAFSEEDAWDVIEEIPNGSAAALLLIEHHWAVPLRDAIASAGGFRISDGFISPLDLVAIGLLSAEEAAQLKDLETAPDPS